MVENFDLLTRHYGHSHPKIQFFYKKRSNFTENIRSSLALRKIQGTANLYGNVRNGLAYNKIPQLNPDFRAMSL